MLPEKGALGPRQDLAGLTGPSGGGGRSRQQGQVSDDAPEQLRPAQARQWLDPASAWQDMGAGQQAEWVEEKTGKEVLELQRERELPEVGECQG